MLDILNNAFPSLVERELSDEYIQTHPDPVWDIPPLPLIRAIPLYMAWCVNHYSEEGELVFEYTITALNMYARAKNSELEWQNFKFVCNTRQREAVMAFLYWCQESLVLDYDPILSRAIRNWESVNKAIHATSA